MNPIALPQHGYLDVQALDHQELQTIHGGGFPLAPVLVPVGAYLAKTVGDHWGDFKQGVKEGWNAVWKTLR